MRRHDANADRQSGTLWVDTLPTVQILLYSPVFAEELLVHAFRAYRIGLDAANNGDASKAERAFTNARSLLARVPSTPAGRKKYLSHIAADWASLDTILQERGY